MTKTLTICKASAGSGKTFTLAAHYVALLLSGESFRSILAVTFTNKATEEMKQRILTYLYAISKGQGGDFLDKVKSIIKAIRPNAIVNDQTLCQMAGEQFEAILADYDNMKVSTIDSFLQTLLSGMAQMLGKAAGYAVDLDTDHAIREAVDQLMSTHIEEQEGLKETIANYLNKQLDEEQNWDVRDRLLSIARELYKESVQMHQDRIVLDRDLIKAYIRDMEQVEDEQKMVTLEHLNDVMLLSYIVHRIDANQAERNSLLLAKTAYILHEALQPGDADFILEKVGIRYKHIMLDEFQDTSLLQWANFLHLIQEILAGGGTALIVGDIKQSIYRWRNGDWHIMAGLTESHPSLGNYLQEEPLQKNFRSCREVVKFNLETFSDRYGEKYDANHLENYYRSGDKEGGYVELRWYPFSRSSTKPTKTGKMPSDAVRLLRGENQRQAMLHDMLAEIETLLQQGDKPSDMLILIRKRAQAQDILSVYQQLIQDHEHYPNLLHHRPVSNDSYVLETSPAVMMVMQALRFVAYGDTAARHFVHLHNPNVSINDLNGLDRNMPLSFLVEEIIRLCLCPEGEYTGSDIAYLNCLKDKIHDYISTYGSNLNELIRYWDDKMHAEAIPSTDTGDIRIMTIHSAKGLEAKNVFIPYCSWPMEDDDKSSVKLWCDAKHQPSNPEHQMKMVPISNKKAIQSAGYEQEYKQEHDDERMDNTNLLYVALTRAANRLFVYSDLAYSAKGAGDTAGHLLLNRWNAASNVKTMWENWHEGDEQWLSWTTGTIFTEPVKKNANKEKELKPFSFDDADVVEAHFYSDNRHIEFRQSQEAQNGNRDFGTLCHDMMSHIANQTDAERIIQDYWARGLIMTTEQKERAEQAIADIFADTTMADFFSERWTVWSERAILPDDFRPDRVMVDEQTKEAIVLDYKFGAMRGKYLDQVRQYMTLIREIGYQVKGCIWVAQEKRLIWIS
ncbi:MAG: UvrD-helicase domain-containing protein [Paludibacteraceae bacterium]|nr:UvrD-helicase domain-containing protein [Paludibacteraceae bacterium]